MRRLILQIIFAIIIFAGGIALGVQWHARRARVSPKPIASASPSSSPAIESTPEIERAPLTKRIVSRALQTQSFRTDKLRPNSDHEIVWRWLRESITSYPQNWVKLDISDQHSYGVVLYPAETIDRLTLIHCNNQLAQNKLPPMTADKRYIRVQVYVDDIICPNWEGFIDMDEARLMYFEGISG